MATQVLTPNSTAFGQLARRPGGIRASCLIGSGKARVQITPRVANCYSRELPKTERESRVLDLVPLVRRVAVKMRRTLPTTI